MSILIIMNPGNFSPQKMFAEMAKAHQPKCQFQGNDQQYFQQWKAETLPQVIARLGKNPPGCDPNPHFVAEWMHDGLHKQRWQDESTCPDIPKDLSPDK